MTEDESCECPSCHRALGKQLAEKDSANAGLRAECGRLEEREAKALAERDASEAALVAAEAREARLRVVVQRCFDASDHCASLTCFATEFETHFPELCAALAQKPDTFALSAALASEWERGAKAMRWSLSTEFVRRLMPDVAGVIMAEPVPPRPEDK